MAFFSRDDQTMPDDARTPNLPLPDLKGLLTGIWSAPVGVMRTYDFKGLGTPTIWYVWRFIREIMYKVILRNIADIYLVCSYSLVMYRHLVSI